MSYCYVMTERLKGVWLPLIPRDDTAISTFIVVYLKSIVYVNE